MASHFYPIKQLFTSFLVVTLLLCQQICALESLSHARLSESSHGDHHFNHAAHSSTTHHHHKNNENDNNPCCKNHNPILAVSGLSLEPKKAAISNVPLLLQFLAFESIGFRVAIADRGSNAPPDTFIFQQILSSLSSSPNAPPVILA